MKICNHRRISIDDYFKLFEGKNIKNDNLKFANTDLIDLGSAASVHIHEISKKTLFLDDFKEAMDLAFSYPSITNNDNNFIDEFSDKLVKISGKKYNKDSFMIFNGVYGSYKVLFNFFEVKSIFVPEFMHESTKEAFRLLGANLIEINNTKEGLLDLDDLKKKVFANKDVNYFYLVHNRGPILKKEYLDEIYDILSNNKLLCFFDLDFLITSTKREYSPASVLRDDLENVIYLINLSKEFGAPGLRVGVGITDYQRAKAITQFSKKIYEIVPSINKELATKLVKRFDIKEAEKTFNKRINLIRKNLLNLGWKDKKDFSGLNIFIQTPISFLFNKIVSPDKLFSYFILAHTGVLFNPSSYYGDRIRTEIRIVASQPSYRIKEAFERLNSKEVSYNMPLPIFIEEEYKNNFFIEKSDFNELNNQAKEESIKFKKIFENYTLAEKNGNTILMKEYADQIRFSTPLSWLIYKLNRSSNSHASIKTLGELKNHAKNDGTCKYRLNFIKNRFSLIGLDILDEKFDKVPIEDFYQSFIFRKVLLSKEAIVIWQEKEFYKEKWGNYKI